MTPGDYSLIVSGVTPVGGSRPSVAQGQWIAIYGLDVQVPAGLAAGSKPPVVTEIISLFVCGLAAAPAGTSVAPATFTPTVSLTANSSNLTVLGTALVAAGEYQMDMQLPPGIHAATYTLTLTVPGGSTADAGDTVVLPVTNQLTVSGGSAPAPPDFPASAASARVRLTDLSFGWLPTGPFSVPPSRRTVGRRYAVTQG